MNPIPHVCGVCKGAIDDSLPKAFDMDFGDVCHPCKVNLRWAYAYLNKKETGLRAPTPKELPKLSRK